MEIETAYIASGCFWGTEYFIKKLGIVTKTEVGYMGGNTENPTYEQICTGTTGHAEIVKVEFKPGTHNYEKILIDFFETHDFTQIGGVGPDIGDQYRSEIFYTTEEQKQVALKLTKILTDKGYKVSTKITPASKYWEADLSHQNYYYRVGGTPYCHVYKKIF